MATDYIPQGIVDLARMAEMQSVALGQTLDVLGLAWGNHLRVEDRKHVGEWSHALDEMRARLRDLLCDYVPNMPVAAPAAAHEGAEGSAERSAEG